MSQAEALLNTLYVDDDVIVEHDYNEIEPHIVIGIDRFVTVPDILKRIAVQHDHNVRTVTFDCPRYYDGRDMASMKVYINVQAPNRNEGSYVADNVRINRFDGNVMHFDWTITRAITPSDGELRFLVCIKKVDEEGNEENHWNSEICDDMYISKGMEYEEIMFNEHPDIITQLLDRMDTIEYIATPEYMEETVDKWLSQNVGGVTGMIEEKGEEILASIPNDYTETSKLAEAGESNARTKADAITRTVTGNAIVAHDSSDDYLRNLKLFGKTTQITTTGAQLAYFPDGELVGTKGVSAMTKNNVVTLYGSITDTSVTYPISVFSDPVDLSMLSEGDTLYATNCTMEYILNGETRYGSVVPFVSGVTYLRAYVQRSKETYVNGEVIYPMLSKIPDAAFEPYSGGIPAPNPEYPLELESVVNPIVNIYGKNLVNLSTHSGNSNYQSLISTFDLRNIKKNKTYTLSVWLNSEVNSTAYWNNAAKVFGYSEFEVRAGLHRYTYTFVAVSDGELFENPVNVLNKYPTNDDKTITALNAQIEEGSEVTDHARFDNQNIRINRELLAIGDIKDEVDFDRGVFIQRVKKLVLDGSERWYTTSATRIYLDLEDNATNSGDGYCSHFDYWYNYNGDCIFATNNHIYLGQVASARFSVDVEQWKDFLAENPMTVIYPLANPIVTDLTEEELEWFRNAHTNYHDTTVINNADAEMELKYNADTEIYVNNLIKMNASIKATTVTLSASKWVGTTYGYSQVVTMNGVTPNSKIDLQPSPEQLANLMAAEVSLTTSNNNGVITIHAIGGYPATDMTMQVQITEVITV